MVYVVVASGFFWSLLRAFEKNDGWLYFLSAAGLLFSLVVIGLEMMS